MKLKIIISLLLILILLTGCSPIKHEKGSQFLIKDDKVYTLLRQEIVGADPNSMEDLGVGLLKDKNNVYCIALCYKPVHILEGVKNVSALDYIVGVDKVHMIFGDDSYVYRLHIVTENPKFELFENSDPKTFTYLNIEYSKDKNNVYHYFEKINGSDGSTFEFVNGSYSKDKNHVYINGRVIDGLNPDYFEVVSDEIIKDDKKVYYNGNEINGIDAKTFEYIGNQNGRVYSRDKDYLFSGTNKFSSADPNTFEIVSENYEKDKDNVFNINQRMRKYVGGTRQWESFQVADINTFEVIYENGFAAYAKDKNYIYSKNTVINGADPSTFEVLSDSYSKDKNHVYCGTGIVEGVDRETFKVLKDGVRDISAQDKNNNYSCTKIV